MIDIGPLDRAWFSTGLTPEVGEELLRRWSEPHRHYHGLGHLRAGLGLLQHLAAPQDEEVQLPRDLLRILELAWWFHDAIHHNDPPQDELASAELAREVLTGRVDESTATEVSRLVLATVDHAPTPEDLPASWLCDIDLHALTLSWPDYLTQVVLLRRERPTWSERTWRAHRLERVRSLLDRPTLFHTARGRLVWEPAARSNLEREIGLLAKAGHV